MEVASPIFTPTTNHTANIGTCKMEILYSYAEEGCDGGLPELWSKSISTNNISHKYLSPHPLPPHDMASQ